MECTKSLRFGTYTKKAQGTTVTETFVDITTTTTTTQKSTKMEWTSGLDLSLTPMTYQILWLPETIKGAIIDPLLIFINLSMVMIQNFQNKNKIE